MAQNMEWTGKLWQAGKTVASECAGCAASVVAFGMIATAAVAVARVLHPEAAILQPEAASIPIAFGLPLLVSVVGGVGVMTIMNLGVAPSAAMRGWREAGIKAAPRLMENIKPLLKNVGLHLASGAAAIGLMAGADQASGLASGGLFLCGVAATMALVPLGIFKPLMAPEVNPTSKPAIKTMDHGEQALEVAPTGLNLSEFHEWRVARALRRKEEFFAQKAANQRPTF